MPLHSSSVIPSFVLKSLRVLASLWLCVDERRSVCTFSRPTFEVLDESVKRRSNFEATGNCNRVESSDPMKDCRYKVNPCRTSAYRSLQLTIGS